MSVDLNWYLLPAAETVQIQFGRGARKQSANTSAATIC